MNTKEITDYLYSKGFVDDGCGVGCSYVNFYFSNGISIITSDENNSMSEENIDLLLITLENQEGEPIGVCLDSKFPFMQFALSDLEMVKDTIERIFAANEVYEKLMAVTKLSHEQALLTALESIGFFKKA